jgi:hypothetical protein
MDNTRIARRPAPPDYTDTLVVEETLTSSTPIVIAHIITDERVTVPIFGVVLLAFALLGAAALWAAGWAPLLLVAFVIAIAVAVGRS